jgi:hypothetical protein
LDFIIPKTLPVNKLKITAAGFILSKSDISFAPLQTVIPPKLSE